MKRQSIFMYVIVLLCSIFVIFFLGKGMGESGKSKMMVVNNGLQYFRKGMDIAGGVRLTYKIDLSKYEEAYGKGQQFAQVTKGIKDIILRNIDMRISKLGVSDYHSYIQSLNDGEYVVVEIGGVFDLDQAKEIIGKTVELEFKTQYEGDEGSLRNKRQLVAENILQEASKNPGKFQDLGYMRERDNIFYQKHIGISLDALPQIYRNNTDVLNDRQSGSIYPRLLSGVYDKTFFEGEEKDLVGRVIVKYNGSTVEILGTGDQKKEKILYDIEEIFVHQDPLWVQARDPITQELLNGAFFRYANVDQSQTGQPTVVVNFNDQGKEIFCNLTTQIVGKPMAIFVGGKLVTSPIIREKICGGSAQISGDFTPEEAKKMVDDLNEGALPAKLILSHEEKVSPSLGEMALEGAMIAAGVGILCVFIYMTFMYGRRQGLVSLGSLLTFLLVLFALIKLLGYALSLSGIAAILLSIGMGVDANVLIYERINEELKLKKPWKYAVEDAYQRSWSAIRDGNFTTFMIALLLFFMGTNVFKGFGTMMMVNILLTLFVIVPVTRMYLLMFSGSELINKTKK